MENFRYKYNLDKRSRTTTLAVSLLAVVLAGILWFYSREGGQYLTAWFVSLEVFVILLLVFNFPRTLVVREAVFEVRCVLNIIAIDRADIVSVRRLSRASLRYIIPIWACHGFGGYFGYYYNLSSRKILRVHASRWENLVQIETRSGSKYVVSCDDTRGFIAAIRPLPYL